MKQSLSSSAKRLRQAAIKVFDSPDRHRHVLESGSTLAVLEELSDDSDWRIRYLVVVFLGDLKEVEAKAISCLTKALGDSSWDVRRRAALGLLDHLVMGRVPLDAVLNQLGTAERIPGRTAPRWIGSSLVLDPKATMAELLGTFDEVPQQAIRWLTEQASTADSEDSRKFAVTSLLRLASGNTEAIRALLVISRDDPKVARSLSIVRQIPEELFPALLEFGAVGCVANLARPIPAAVDFLLEHADRSSDMYDGWLWAVGKLIRSRADLARMAIKRLAKRAQAGDQRVAFRAFPILCQIDLKDPAALAIFVEAYDDPELTEWALESLTGRRPNETASRAPWRRLFLDPIVMHHHLAAIALARHGTLDALVVHKLMNAASSGIDKVSEAANAVIAKDVLPSSIGLDLLLSLLEGSPAYNAVPSMRKFTTPLQPHQLGTLRRLLNSPSVLVRRFAADCLYHNGVEDQEIHQYLDPRQAANMTDVLRRGVFPSVVRVPGGPDAWIGSRILAGTSTSDDIDKFLRSEGGEFFDGPNDVWSKLLAIAANRDERVQELVATYILNWDRGKTVCAALGELDKPTRRVVEQLLAATKISDSLGEYLRNEARAALAKLFLSNSYVRKDWDSIFVTDSSFRDQIVRGCESGFAAPDDTMEFLLQLTRHPDGMVRADSLEILTRLHDVDGRVAARVVQMFRDPTFSVRRISFPTLESYLIENQDDIDSIWALSELGKGAGRKAESPRWAIRSTLALLLADKVPAVRKWAVNMLANVDRSRPENLTFLRSALEDKSEDVRLEAARAIIYGPEGGFQVEPFFAMLRDGRGGVVDAALKVFSEDQTDWLTNVDYVDRVPPKTRRQIIKGMLWSMDQMIWTRGDVEVAISSSENRTQSPILFRRAHDENIGGTTDTAKLVDVAPFVIFTLMLEKMPPGTYDFQADRGLTHGLLSVFSRSFGVWHN